MLICFDNSCVRAFEYVFVCVCMCECVSARARARVCTLRGDRTKSEEAP